MRRKQNPFAEMGGASSFVTLFKDYGMGFRGSDDQRDLTPLQRQIIEAEEVRRAEAQEQKHEEMREQATGGGGQSQPSRTMNSRAGGGGGGGSGGNGYAETTRYVNRAENPDFSP